MKKQIYKNLIFAILAAVFFWAGNSFAEEYSIPGDNEEEWAINEQILENNNETDIRDYLADPRDSVRLTACMRLAEIGSGASLAQLETLARNDPEYDITRAAAQALWRIKYRQLGFESQEVLLLSLVEAASGNDYSDPTRTAEVIAWAMELLGDRGSAQAKPYLQAIIDTEDDYGTEDSKTPPFLEYLKEKASENLELINFIITHPSTIIEDGLRHEELRVRRFALEKLIEQKPIDLLARLELLIEEAQANLDYEFLYYLQGAQIKEKERTRYAPIEIETPADGITVKIPSIEIIGSTYGKQFREDFPLRLGANTYTKSVTRDGLTSSLSITINRQANAAPVLATISNKLVLINMPLSFRISATDADDANLVYFIFDQPDKSDFNYQSKTFSWTPRPISAGQHRVIFEADDGYGLSDTKTALIEVIGYTSSTPTLLQAVAESPTRVNLTWQDNSRIETGFRIQRADSEYPDWFYEIGTVAANTITYKDEDKLLPGHSYVYRVCAYNLEGNSPYSKIALVTTPVVAPAAPENLVAQAVSTKQINLSWEDKSDNETGFKIERRQGDIGAFTEVATVASNITFYNDRGLNPETTYWYQVRAYNSGGNSDYSPPASATTWTVIPPAPDYLSATAASSSQIDLRWWDNARNESGFKLERSLNANSGFSEIRLLGANFTNCSDTGLNAGTTYYYRIRAYNSEGNSGYSPVASATTWKNIPAAPGNLAATTNSASQINLTWQDNSNDETGFKLDRSFYSNFTFSETFSLGANVTSYTEYGLAPGTTCYYRLRAYNERGYSAYSNVASATTLSDVPLAPQNLSATTMSATQINLNWQDNSSNETGFKIERREGEVGAFAQIATVTNNITAYNDTGLNPETTYYYRVRVYNNSGNSEYSLIASATTLGVIPAAPSLFSAIALSATQVKLNWQDNSDNETGFKIERSLNSTTGFTQVSTVAANITTYTDSGLNENTTYYYRLYAYNSVGNSPYIYNSVTTLVNPPAAPSGLSAAAVSATQINLNWQDNSSNETGFKIERSLSSTTGFSLLTTLNSNVTTYNDTNVVPTTTYYYRVFAYSSAGNSAYAQASATTPSLPLPVAPSGLSATSVSATQVRLSWQDNADNEEGFKIERSTNFGAPVLYTASANTTSYTDSAVTEHTTYYYRVIAFNRAGSAYSNTVTVTTPYAPPTNLQATALSSSQISLTWIDNSRSELYFSLERSIRPDSGFLQILQPAQNMTTITNSGLIPATKYYYRIRAYNIGGWTDYSNVASATTLTADIPVAPSNLAATVVSESMISLSWQYGLTSITGFKIEMAYGFAPGDFFVIATLPRSSRIYPKTGLSDDTTYYFRIKAYNRAGDSAPSAVVSAKTLPTSTAPTAPTNLTASSDYYDLVILTWQDTSMNEKGFKIERSTTSASSGFSLLDTRGANELGGETGYTDLSVSPKTTYYYRVSAFNNIGKSAYSNVATVTTPNAPQ